MSAYQIFTDATADMNFSLPAELPAVGFIPMKLEIGGKEYTYGPSGTISAGEFYALQRAGNFGTTSQINPTVYSDCFEPCLQQGKDILYLCFTSGMSGTFQAAQLCAGELQEKYPNQKIICVDTLCASIGEGLLVQEAARKQGEGCSMEEVGQWVMEHRLQVCHWFTVDIFDHLRHGGRVSAASAFVGTALQIKPLLHVDEQGRLAVMEKPRGRKRAIAAQIARMEQGWQPEISSSIVIGHGDDPAAAAELKEAVEKRFPQAKIDVAEIGPIIGSHTGPGMLALVYWGKNR